MAHPFDPTLPTAPEKIPNLSSHPDPFVLSNLGDKLGASASEWGSEHVCACRVLKVTEAWHSAFLSPFRSNHEALCPICHPNDLCSQKVTLGMVEHVRKHVSRLRTASESSLYSLPAGRFRLALARLMRSDSQGPSREYGTRESSGKRKRTEHPNHVPSSSIPFPESSSPARPPSSEYSGSHASVPLDDDQNDSRARKPESLVTSLSGELFSLTLYSILEQSNPKDEYCFRLESHTSTAEIAGTAVVGADDGGLCRKRLIDSSWTTTHPSLIMGECKPASRNLFYNAKTEIYFPFLTTSAFAQLVGEAIIAWKQDFNTELFRDGVYSYICNGTFIRFFHFDFGCYYATYLDAATKKEQLDLVRKYPGDTCVRVSSTRWFDLEKPKDMVLAICHILTRLRLEEAKEAGEPPGTVPALAMDATDTSDTSSESDYYEM